MTDPKHKKRTRDETLVKKERVLKRMDWSIPSADTRSLDVGKVFDTIGDAGPDGEYKIFSLASTMVDLLQEDPDRITGQQVREGGRYGGSLTNSGSGQRHRQWQFRAGEIWRENPGLSKSEVARCIVRDCADSHNTIRQVIQKPSALEHDSI
jgi:hypothetical protein